MNESIKKQLIAWTPKTQQKYDCDNAAPWRQLWIGLSGTDDAVKLSAMAV